MGISIKLRILPNRIENEAWKSAYKECLQLVKYSKQFGVI